MNSVQDLLYAADDLHLANNTRSCVQNDPLFIFHIAQNISQTGAWPGLNLTQSCCEEIDVIKEIAPQTCKTSFEQCLPGKHVDQALQWLQRIGVIKYLLPELEATVALRQEGQRKHKDVWEHTVLVVKQTVPDVTMRWAALLHDIGKVPTRTFMPNGSVHFRGHALVGAKMFDKISKRLPFEPQEKTKIRFLIAEHLRCAQYSRAWTDSAVRRFAKDMEPYCKDLLNLSRADITSKIPGKRQTLLQGIHDLEQRIKSLKEQDEQPALLPKGFGASIMKEFNLPPSKKIGLIKEAVEGLIERNELQKQQETDYYVDWLKSNRHIITAIVEG